MILKDLKPGDYFILDSTHIKGGLLESYNNTTVHRFLYMNNQFVYITIERRLERQYMFSHHPIFKLGSALTYLMEKYET